MAEKFGMRPWELHSQKSTLLWYLRMNVWMDALIEAKQKQQASEKRSR